MSKDALSGIPEGRLLGIDERQGIQSTDNNTRSTANHSCSSSSSSGNGSSHRPSPQDDRGQSSTAISVPPSEDFISSFLDDFKEEWEKGTEAPKRLEKKRRKQRIPRRQCTMCRLPISSCTCGSGRSKGALKTKFDNGTNNAMDITGRCHICRQPTTSCICDAGQGPVPNDDDVPKDDDHQNITQPQPYDPHHSARQLDLLTATLHSSDGMVPYEDDSRSNDGFSSLDGGVSSVSSFPFQPQQHTMINQDSHRSVHSGSQESINSQTNHTATTPVRRLDALTRSTHSGQGITPYEDENDNDGYHHHNNHRTRHSHQDSFVRNDENRLAYPGYDDDDQHNNDKNLHYPGTYDDSFLITDDDEDQQGDVDVYGDERYDEDGGYGLRGGRNGERIVSSSLFNHHRHHQHHHPGKVYLGSVDERGETHIGDDEENEYFHDDHEKQNYGQDDDDDDDHMSMDSYDRRKKWIPILLFCGGFLALIVGVGVGAGLGMALTGDGAGQEGSTAEDKSASTPEFRPPDRNKGTAPTISPTQAPTGTSTLEIPTRVVASKSNLSPLSQNTMCV